MATPNLYQQYLLLKGLAKDIESIKVRLDSLERSQSQGRNEHVGLEQNFDHAENELSKESKRNSDFRNDFDEIKPHLASMWWRLGNVEQALAEAYNQSNWSAFEPYQRLGDPVTPPILRLPESVDGDDNQ
ncbi:MAG: hypothetical protein F4X94_07545 [Dehalococcoidia bacterium]|nr:hypothetical protein [Dehalococcoidia bacterium]